MRRVASKVPISAEPPESRAISGHSSMTPLTTKIVTSARFWRMNSPTKGRLRGAGRPGKRAILTHRPVEEPQHRHPDGHRRERMARARRHEQRDEAGDEARIRPGKVENAVGHREARHYD